MENRKELQIRDLTPDQLYALELQARRLRAVEMARLFDAAVTALKHFVRGTPRARASEVRHA